jgi:protein TonB
MAAGTASLQPQESPRRRRVDGFEGRVTRDRLASMLVLAALLNGLVLLGVTFTAPISGSRTPRGLEVLLVSSELPEARDNEDAAYVAQRSQEGAGNTRDGRTARLPGAQPQDQAEASAAQGVDPFERVITTSVPSLSTIRIEAAPEAELQISQQELERVLAGDPELVLRGEERPELYDSPDTRASRAAPWLHDWVQRVERIGTARFQALARQRESGSLLIEVVVNSDGQLRRASILRSSGNAQLDDAAREILRLASPFDPFPPELARDYRSLRFAYEWRFERGSATGSTRLP